MSQPSSTPATTREPAPRTPPAESELKQFGRLLDEFFATVSL